MINKVILMGRLTADPEARTTSTGKPVTSFTLACDRNQKDKQTDFLDIVAWNHTAEFICKYFRKGQMIAVAGSIQTRTWEDKNGNKRKAVEVLAEEVSFCGDKKPVHDGADIPGAERIPQKPINNFEDVEWTDEDIPF